MCGRENFGQAAGLSRRAVLGGAAGLIVSGTFVAAAAEDANAAAQNPLPAENPLPVQEVAAGIFVYQAPYALADQANAGAVANVGFIIGRDSVAVIDTGNSLIAGQRLRAAVRAHTALPIRYVIFTHMHPDHVLGAAAFADDGAVVIGAAKLPRALTARAQSYLDAAARVLGPSFAGTQVIEPTREVDGTDWIDLGDRRLLMQTYPTAHTDNDLSLFDEATGTLFLGDLLFVGHVPSVDGSTLGWISVLKAIAARRDVRQIVPGHGPAILPFPQGLAGEQRYLTQLVADARALLASGGDIGAAPDRVAASERERWALFDEFNPRNAIATFHEVEWE